MLYTVRRWNIDCAAVACRMIEWEQNNSRTWGKATRESPVKLDCSTKYSRDYRPMHPLMRGLQEKWDLGFALPEEGAAEVASSQPK